MIVERIKAFFAATGTFFREVVGELKKVVWPDKARVAKLTGVVAAMVVVMAAFLLIVDMAMSFGMEKLVNR